MNKKMFQHHGSPLQCPICRNIMLGLMTAIIIMAGLIYTLTQ